ncbi:TIGR03767 family metallophosphoesterase [Rathayibacter oskolensis]|uniref:TIGR03767 family metallophosphoesterase n=1 Tax=Rathayibacter oskolensis TaxID=1891671 RepID=UPI00265DF295|nr:TIGR03767 family metallophosphoesterase [Rathayibacter oskolensis]WKK71490.1 TIGR03767 family metallophosphoesterase [Rathayibacter oskolensis]
MPGLSRRRFTTTVGLLAAASGLGLDRLGALLSAPVAAAAEAPSTLTQTILQGSVISGQYRGLRSGPGEPYVARIDVLRTAPAAGRTAARRSLLYLGHLSDLHVIDSESPGRIEPMIVQDHAAWGSAFHPQDALTVHATAAMVKAFADVRYSPLTGAAMEAAIVTGDSADMHSHHELRWYIDILDGVSVTPSSGSGSVFEGVQAWPEATWAYRPGDPTGGDFGDYGFPRLPDLLAQASSTPVDSVGLPVPWYTVYGNHETLLLGTFDIGSQLRALAVGGQKSFSLEGTASAVLGGYAASASPVQRLLDALGVQLGGSGFRAVSSDSRRRLFSQRDFMVEHFDTQPTPARPVTVSPSTTSTAARPGGRTISTPSIRAFGLDTCNQVAGPDGAVPDDQFQWLKGELEKAQAEKRLVLIFSHHNSLTLENRAQRPGQDQTLHGAEEFVDLLLQYPVVVGWLNGHTHLNQILPHRGERGGFWEITTASCIDFPQQQQTVELVDNRDGTLSIFTTVLDHASPVTPGTSGGYLDLASQSRELAANDWAEDLSCAVDRRSTATRSCCCLLPSICRRSPTGSSRRSSWVPGPGSLSTKRGISREALRVAAARRATARGLLAGRRARAGRRRRRREGALRGDRRAGGSGCRDPRCAVLHARRRGDHLHGVRGGRRGDYRHVELVRRREAHGHGRVGHPLRRVPRRRHRLVHAGRVVMLRSWLAVVLNAVVQALLVIGDPDVTASPVFVVLVAVSVLSVLVTGVLISGRPSVRLVLWVAGILVVTALVAVVAPWAVVVPLLGVAFLPAVAAGEARPVAATLGVLRVRVGGSVLAVLGLVVIVAVGWIVALVLGFFVTRFVADLLTWLWFGASAVLVVEWFGRLYRRGAGASSV